LTITASGPSGHNFYALGSYTNVGNTSGSDFTGPANSAPLAANSSFVFSGANAISMTSNNTSGTAHPNVQPSVAVSYLLRVI